jgi:hypothetical protein
MGCFDLLRTFQPKGRPYIARKMFVKKTSLNDFVLQSADFVDEQNSRGQACIHAAEPGTLTFSNGSTVQTEILHLLNNTSGPILSFFSCANGKPLFRQ